MSTRGAELLGQATIVAGVHRESTGWYCLARRDAVVVRCKAVGVVSRRTVDCSQRLAGAAILMVTLLACSEEPSPMDVPAADTDYSGGVDGPVMFVPGPPAEAGQDAGIEGTLTRDRDCLYVGDEARALGLPSSGRSEPAGMTSPTKLSDRAGHVSAAGHHDLRWRWLPVRRRSRWPHRRRRSHRTRRRLCRR